MGVDIALVLVTLVGMEGIAWFTHKYVMHGFMWNWHHSHHNHHKGFLEVNDLFSVVFGVAATVTIMVGMNVASLWFLAPMGIGISLYGIFYFVFHDIIVHRRIRIKFSTKNQYLQRITRAHYVHHRVHERDGAEAFGFLYAPPKYEKTDAGQKRTAENA